jgi:dTMP kinase
VTNEADRGRGRLVVLEGIDGCGKSTQAKSLAPVLGALLTAEPGATSLGSDLRTLLLDESKGPVSVRAEALMMAADRAEHVAQVLIPALSDGTWVVCDRFTSSTIAYQGYGRGLDLAELQSVTAFAACGVEPDLQVLLDVTVEVARARMKPASADRLEHLGDDFFGLVRQGYLSLARADAEHWVVVDGTAGIDEVAGLILHAVTERLGSPPERTWA